MGNIITVNMNYGCCRTEQYITDQKLYQYDYGQILKLTGIELPAVYEVHYKGKVYESLIDNNVWSPEAYPQGWKLIEE